MLSEDIFHQRGITLLYRTSNLIIQSGLYGIYASLIPVSTFIMIQKGLHATSQKILFGVIVFMFSLSTAYLAVSIADLIILIKTWFLVQGLSESTTSTRSPKEALLTLFNALAPINYVLTDGVVVWRAWIICRDECRKLLRVPIVMFILTMLGVLGTIGVRIFINFDPLKRDKGRLAHTLDVSQMVTLISSLITNTLGTGIMSLKAWRYRRWIVADLQRIVDKRTKAERVLGLLVESGVLYMFSGAMLVASSVIRLPGSHFILGSLYSQAAVHLAGIYPLIVVILVNRESSMDNTLFNATLPVIITNLKAASSHFEQSAGRGQVKSTPPAGFQIDDNVQQGTRSVPDSLSSSQLSLPSQSNSGPETDVDPECLLGIDGGGDEACLVSSTPRTREEHQRDGRECKWSTNGPTVS